MLRPSRVLAPILTLALLLPACGDDDDDGTGPDGFDPEDLIGTFVLSPEPSMTCDLSTLGTATITIDTVEVTDATEDSVYVRLPLLIETALVDMRNDVEFALGLDLDAQTFGGGTDLDIDAPVGFTTVHGDGQMSVIGEFDDAESFDMSVSSDLDVAVGDGTPVPCSSIDLDVTGTRD
jgi:hypothetical protein